MGKKSKKITFFFIKVVQSGGEWCIMNANIGEGGECYAHWFF